MRANIVSYNKGHVPIYGSEGMLAYCEFEAALAEGEAVMLELAQCSMVEVYHLLASDLFDRLASAHGKTVAAFIKTNLLKL